MNIKYNGEYTTTEEIREFIANPTGIDVEEFKAKIPIKGDEITLLDGAYSLLPSIEAAKLARLPFVTVDDSLKIIITDSFGELPHFTYSIYIKESGYLVGLYGQDWIFYDKSHNLKNHEIR